MQDPLKMELTLSSNDSSPVTFGESENFWDKSGSRYIEMLYFGIWIVRLRKHET